MHICVLFKIWKYIILQFDFLIRWNILLDLSPISNHERQNIIRIRTTMYGISICEIVSRGSVRLGVSRLYLTWLSTYVNRSNVWQLNTIRVITKLPNSMTVLLLIVISTICINRCSWIKTIFKNMSDLYVNWAHCEISCSFPFKIFYNNTK
jgi:hypothetical protein